MPKLLDPFRFLLTALAGWMNQRHLQAIDYLREENRVLREQLDHRRLSLTDDQRRRLAAKAKGLGGPCNSGEIEALIVRLAEENRDWGYRRMQGALSNLGHEIARSTIAHILQRHGIEPAPERNRKTTWKEFHSHHWELIVAADFFTVEVGTRRGLQRFVVLFPIVLSNRRVKIAAIAPQPDGLWMGQVGRNLTDAESGILAGKRYLIHDRDPLFMGEFLGLLAESGVKSVKLPPRSPNLNAHAERFVRSIKESCLERMIFFGEGALRKAFHEYVAHYHGERNHEDLRNRIIHPDREHFADRGPTRRRQRLGGMLNYYNQTAA